jgi:multidrug efflux pump subunit AcrA (membrane-fusion protein)
VKKPARLRRSAASPPSPRRLLLPRRPLEWGLAIVAVALVAIAITSLGAGSSSSSAATKRTATVGKGIVQSTVSGNGTLEPAQKVELGFGASGEVTAIRVKVGQKVSKGEVLAEVDSSSARASLASAEAQLIEAEEAVETAEEAEEESEEVAYEGGARTVFVGLMSEDGTGAAKADEAEKKAAAEKEAAEKAAEEAEEEKTNKKEETSAKGDESKSGAEEPEKPEASEEAAASGANQDAVAESEGSEPTEGASGGGSETGGNETGATGGISLPTADANLLSAELSVKSARQEVRETTLRAPISGTIASISGSVGETVSGGSGTGNSEGSSPSATGAEEGGGSESFMVLAQLQRLKMEVSFSEADIGKVREGQTATVAIDSMEGTELAGKVTKVSVLPSEGSSSSVVEYPAMILLTQSAKGLRAGMSASAEVVVEQMKNALTVPSEAISQAAGGKTVTVEEEGKEVTKTVTTGLAGDETTEVMSGVKAGQTLVLPEATVAAASEGSGGGSLEELRASGGAGTFTFPGGGATGGPPGGAAQFFGGGR